MVLTGERYDELQREVVSLLDSYGLYEYPLDIDRVLSSMRIKERSYSELPSDVTEQMRSLSRDATTVIDGRNGLIRPTILFDETVPVRRIRFSKAHEAAHIYLEHLCDDEPYETEAN